MTEPPTVIDVGRNIAARFSTEWDTGIELARITDGDFALVMRKDDYDALAQDTAALILYFDARRADHAAGRPVGSTRAERVAQFRATLDTAG